MRTMPDPLRPEEIAIHLNSFRPSNQNAIEQAFESVEGRTAVIEAVKLYVERWERADWVEVYTVERIGKWLGRSAPREIVDALRLWAVENPDAEEKRPRRALFDGLQKGFPGRH